MCGATNSTDERCTDGNQRRSLITANSATETLLTQTGPMTNKKELHHA